MADDYVRGASNECSFCKQFDIFTYPYRLQPLRGMTNSGELTGSGMTNMILASNGAMYGIGKDPGNPNNGELYKRTGFGASDFWTDFTQDQLSGAANTDSTDDFLVYFPAMGAARKLFWASTNLIMASDTGDGNSADSDALTFATIGQGIVHPTLSGLYFPYKTTTTSYIGLISTHASDPFGTVNYTAFALPFRYRCYGLSYYQDFIAAPLTIPGVSGNKDQSIVGLWDTDTSLTDFNITIPWGSGSLKVLNNLNGTLIGISALASEIGSAAAQDQDKIQIKVWDGGTEPQLIKEIVATRLTTTNPSVAINQRVNFIHNNRLYFSCNVVNGDADANYYGLWSVGKNKFGEWTVVQERCATNDNSETGIIAAAMYGDFLSCIHTAAGTLTYTINGNTLSAIYGATSVYESCINPRMAEISPQDLMKKKTLVGMYVTCLPLPAAGQIVIKYRLDALKSTTFSTAVTETTDGVTLIEVLRDTNGAQFGTFTNLEMRIESTGGAIVTGYGYVYDPINSQLT